MQARDGQGLHAALLVRTHDLMLTMLPRACRPAMAKGFMQLYSFEQQKSQPLEAHAASFASVKVSEGRPATWLN